MANSAWRCAARCCGARSPDATPATGSSAIPIRSPSWPRPKSSSRPCFPCWRAERTRDRLPDAAVHLHVGPALAADLDDARLPCGVERTLKGRAKREYVLDALVREDVQRGCAGEVETGRGRDVARVDVLAFLHRLGLRTRGVGPALPRPPHLRAGDREEVEDASAAVVEQH